MSGYTVIDVETTGLVPEKHDRVVEIGLVYVSHSGEVQDQWSTLVNPGRDVGPTDIHGVSASDVHGAPTFRDIAPYVLRAVSGRTIVAHNVTFDLRFLAAEMVRAGIPLTKLPLSGVCTMQWAPAYLRSPSRRLVDCCLASGVKVGDAHSAGADALATALLLSHFLDRSAGQPPWTESLNQCGSYPWPPFPAPSQSCDWYAAQMCGRAASTNGWTESYPECRAPPTLASTRTSPYWSGPCWMASSPRRKRTSSSKSRSRADYPGAKCWTFTVTIFALSPMWPWKTGWYRPRNVLPCNMLPPCSAYGDQTSTLPLIMPINPSNCGDSVESGIALAPGDRVVFTGDMHRDRAEWIHRTPAPLGARWGNSQDPGCDSCRPQLVSGKAAKARAYGVPVITEAAFQGLLKSQFAT